MPFLGLNPSLGKKRGLTKLLPIYFSVYPSVASLGAAGTALSSAVLTAGVVRNRATRATVAGTFSFVDALSTTPPASQKSIAIKFTPTNAAALGYPATITVYVPLSVNRTTPTISVYPTLSSIQYGQTKSEVIFSGGVASCPGTFAFSSSLTRVYVPGTYASLDCTFTPTDTLNFKPVDFVSPNPLVVAKRNLLYSGSFNLTGGGLNQPLSNFTISPSSEFYVITTTINGRSTRLNPTGYTFFSPLTKIVTGTEFELVNVSFSAEDTLYYNSTSSFSVPGYFPSISCPAPTLAAWTLALANTSFTGNNVVTNKVTTEGSSIGSLSVVNAFNNTAGSSNSLGYRFYGKTTPTTLTYEQAVTNGSYIEFNFTASSTSKKVVSGLLRFLCYRGGSGPSKLALVYSDNPTFAYYNIRILSQDVAVPTSSADISFELAGTLLTNPITISENCTGYFRIYYYGQTSQTSPITLVGNRNQDIGFTGVEVQALPSLFYNSKPLHRLQPGAKTNNEATLDDGILYYWQSPLHDLASFRFETFNLSSSSQLKPTYVKEGMNSKPSVRFVSGSSMFMGARSPVGRSSTSSTIIMVARFNSGSGTLYSEGPNGFWLGALDYGVAICEANRNIVIGQAPNSISSNPVVITVRKLSNGNNYLYVNGQLVTNATSTIGSFSNPVANPLGYQLTVSSAASGQNPTTYLSSLGSILSNSTTVAPTPFPFSGLMGDAFFVEDDLPEQDRIFLENYLKNKYGIDQPVPTCNDATSKVLMTGENAVWPHGPRLLTQLVPPYNPYGTGFTYGFGDEVVRHDGGAWIYSNSGLGEIARSYSPVAWPWLATWPDFVATKVCAPDTSTPAPNLIFPERINITGPGVNGNFVLISYSNSPGDQFADYFDDVTQKELFIDGTDAVLYNLLNSNVLSTTVLPIFSFPSSLTGGYRTSTLHTTPTLVVPANQPALSKVYDAYPASSLQSPTIFSPKSTPSILNGDYLLSPDPTEVGSYALSLLEGSKTSKFIWNGPYPAINYTITKRPATLFIPSGTSVPYGSSQLPLNSSPDSVYASVSIFHYFTADAFSFSIGSNGITNFLTGYPTRSSLPGTYTISLNPSYISKNFSIANAPVSQTFTVSKLSQAISFIPSLFGTVGTPATLSASATSSLPVSFSIVSGPGTITNGNILSYTGAGSVVVRASQGGSSIYNPATNVDKTIAVSVPVDVGIPQRVGTLLGGVAGRSFVTKTSPEPVSSDATITYALKSGETGTWYSYSSPITSQNTVPLYVILNPKHEIKNSSATIYSSPGYWVCGTLVNTTFTVQSTNTSTNAGTFPTSNWTGGLEFAPQYPRDITVSGSFAHVNASGVLQYTGVAPSPRTLKNRSYIPSLINYNNWASTSYASQKYKNLYRNLFTNYEPENSSYLYTIGATQTFMFTPTGFTGSGNSLYFWSETKPLPGPDKWTFFSTVSYEGDNSGYYDTNYLAAKSTSQAGVLMPSSAIADFESYNAYPGYQTSLSAPISYNYVTDPLPNLLTVSGGYYDTQFLNSNTFGAVVNGDIFAFYNYDRGLLVSSGRAYLGANGVMILSPGTQLSERLNDGLNTTNVVFNQPSDKWSFVAIEFDSNGPQFNFYSTFQAAGNTITKRPPTGLWQNINVATDQVSVSIESFQ